MTLRKYISTLKETIGRGDAELPVLLSLGRVDLTILSGDKIIVAEGDQDTAGECSATMIVRSLC